MNNRLRNIVLILVLLTSISLFGKTIIKWKSIPVTKYWSRRAVKLDNNQKYFFYRPIRFEKMNIDVTDLKDIQLRIIAKEKGDFAKFTVIINGKETEFNSKSIKNDQNYYYYEPVNLTLEKGTKELQVFTRNPNLYFRAFSKDVKIVKSIPNSLVINANQFKRKVNLVSKKSRNEYYVFDKNQPLEYTVKYNGSVESYVRFFPTIDKTDAQIQVYVNNVLKESYTYTPKISKDYKANDSKISIGRKLKFDNLKKNDQVVVKVLSAHEVLMRSILKTKK